MFWAAGGLGVLVLVGVLALVPESAQRAGGRFDVVGAIGLAVALVSLLLAVSKGGSWGWGSARTVTLFVVAVVVLLAWGLWELRTRQPLVDLRVSRRRQVLLTNTASIVFGFSMFAMSLVLPAAAAAADVHRLRARAVDPRRRPGPRARRAAP